MTGEQLRELLARVVQAREAVSDGDLDLAEAILARVEDDLVGALAEAST